MSVGERDRLVVPPKLKARTVEVARGFRKQPTNSEAVLWWFLRAGKLEGIRFRRQQPIGPFVVDFYCPQFRLIVEVDGSIHDSQRERDAERQSLLEAFGYRVVRVPAPAIETDLPSVLTVLRSQIESIQRQSHPGNPPLSP
jgi:very-short-patch-repair endonuclease